MDLTSPPAGYDSCHGVQYIEDEPSDFKVSCCSVDGVTYILQCILTSQEEIHVSVFL